MGPGLGAVLVFAVAVVLAIVFGLRGDDARTQAYERFAVGVGMEVLPKGSEARAGLSDLPGLPGPGRVVFGAVARSENEVVADVQVTRPQKEIRTDRRATLVAWRREGAAYLRGVRPSVDRSEFKDTSSTGFGRVVVADDGVWVLCRTMGKRVPDDELARFRDYARELVADRLRP